MHWLGRSRLHGGRVAKKKEYKNNSRPFGILRRISVRYFEDPAANGFLWFRPRYRVRQVPKRTRTPEN